MQQPVEADTTTTTDPPPPAELPQEFGGASGPEPTRFGDWERNGRCTDF
jgi:hypothetical protein